MHQTSVVPSGRERTFGVDEFIVTKTDPRGVITYANDVFLQVSGYSEPEVLGRPHNIIRHPRMPRCIFKLLWDTVKGGGEIFAYVVNLARDGDHYWVLAHVTPSFDGSGRITGYHSNRRRPSSAEIATADALYTRLLAEESRHDRPADSLDASGALLHRELAELGQSYDEFVWSFTANTPAEATR